eukprot:256188_1
MSTITSSLLCLFSILYICKSANVLVMGDSWGTLGGPALRKVLDAHNSGLTVKNYAIAGSTSEAWAANASKVSDLVSENADAMVIWLSLGGDDFVYRLSICTAVLPINECANLILNHIINDTQTFMNILFKNHKDIKVVQFGYDIPNFSDDVRKWCNTSGDIVIEQCAQDIFCFNSQMIKIQYQLVDYLAAYYADQGYNYTSLNLLGSLQAAENYTDAYRTHPNLNYWSPADLMLACIHATEPGFDIIMEEMWELYFKNLALNVTRCYSSSKECPNNGICDPNTNICVDQKTKYFCGGAGEFIKCDMESGIVWGECGSGSNHDCFGDACQDKSNSYEGIDCNYPGLEPVAFNTTSWLCGGDGTELSCFHNGGSVMVGVCGSGGGSNCKAYCDGYHGILCADQSYFNIDFGKCSWQTGGYGEWVYCPEGTVATGHCGSGKKAECGHKEWHGIQCCQFVYKK